MEHHSMIHDPAQDPRTRRVLAAGLAFGALVAAAASAAYAQAPAKLVVTDEHRLRVVILARGLDHPWSIAWLPDGRMLVTERAGRLRIVSSDGKIEPAPVAGLPAIEPFGQGGLFDVVLHPRFSENSLVYFAYAGKGADGYGTELARGRLVAGQAGTRLERVELLFRQQPKGQTGRHFGGRIVFDRA